MQLTSYQSPRKKERLELLKFNQTNSPHRYWFHHLRNTKGSAITALNITLWPMVSPYRITRSKNLWIELCWLKILETKQNKKQMKTLKRWKYDSIPYRECLMQVEYDVWQHRIRKPPFLVRPQLNDESRMMLAKIHSGDRFLKTVFMVPAAPFTCGQRLKRKNSLFPKIVGCVWTNTHFIKRIKFQEKSHYQSASFPIKNSEWVVRLF